MDEKILLTYQEHFIMTQLAPQVVSIHEEFQLDLDAQSWEKQEQTQPMQREQQGIISNSPFNV